VQQQTVVSVEDQQAVADIIGKHLASFYINELRCTEFIVINVLFDTGSPVSFVSKTNFPKDVTLAKLFESKYSGIYGRNILLCGVGKCYIMFNLKVYEI